MKPKQMNVENKYFHNNDQLITWQ